MIKRIFLTVVLIITAASFLAAEESPYISLNSDLRWAKTSDNRLVHIVNNPTRYNSEEFIGALHEYAKRHGTFAKAHNLLQALVNAYIAYNPDYESQNTEDIFIQTARSRGVPSLQVYEREEIYEDEYEWYYEDVVETILEQTAEEIASLEVKAEGRNEDGSTYVVYQISPDIERSITIDADGTSSIIENITSVEALNEAVERYTKLFTEPVPYLNGGYEAVLIDSADSYIDNEITAYRGIVTLVGSQMFIEEIRPESKIIIQKQWCTAPFFEERSEELGEGWGFLASWDDEE
jgi:hypothetical protein